VLQDTLGATVVYRGYTHPKLRGRAGRVETVAGSWLRIAFELPGSPRIVVEVPPEDVGLFVVDEGPIVPLPDTEELD